MILVPGLGARARGGAPLASLERQICSNTPTRVGGFTVSGVPGGPKTMCFTVSGAPGGPKTLVFYRVRGAQADENHEFYRVRSAREGGGIAKTMYFTVFGAPGGPKTMYFTVPGAPEGHTRIHTHGFARGSFQPFFNG